MGRGLTSAGAALALITLVGNAPPEGVATEQTAASNAAVAERLPLAVGGPLPFDCCRRRRDPGLSLGPAREGPRALAILSG